MSSKQSGFSIVEIMVGVALLALLLRLAVPSFSEMLQNRQVRTAAEAIQDGLQLARVEAVRRNRAVKFELQSGSGWLVGCEPADTTVGTDGQQNCPATLQTRASNEGTSNASVATAQLVAATLSDASSPVFSGTLTFSGLGRVAPANLPAGNLAVFRVSNPGAGTCVDAGGNIRCLSVVVSAAGQVRMCDPAAPSGDARRCNP